MRAESRLEPRSPEWKLKPVASRLALDRFASESIVIFFIHSSPSLKSNNLSPMEEDGADGINYEQETAQDADMHDHNIEIEEEPGNSVRRHTSMKPTRKSANVRMEHRRRLRRLLGKFRRQHNWKEASGVLSVLLKGTCKEISPMKNQTKYSAAMELLNKLSKKNINLTKVKRIYETWTRKNGAMKKWPAKDKYLIELESVIYRLTHGNFEEEALVCNIGETEIGNDPVLNMMVGMIFYQIWYSSAPEEMKLQKLDTCNTPPISEISGMEGSYNQSENSVGHNANDVEYPVQCESNTSIGNDKKVHMDIDGEMQKKQTNPLSKPHGFYMEDDEEMSGHEQASFPNNSGNISIFRSYGLDASLLPMRMPPSDENFEDSIYLLSKMLNVSYTNAVKHLRIALYSTPPVLSALLPLIQLLLLGDQVQEALEELENLCHSSNAVLPLRLRAMILEGFHSNNSPVLSTCYEDVIKKDPTCTRSLAKLISMHKNGDYGLEPLLEMLALHLDATYATSNVWGELASCFLKLSQCEEDQMSVYENANDGGVEQTRSIPSNVVPKAFIQGGLRKSWKLRCRWWATRHFSKNSYTSEMDAETDDLQLPTFKAACASHMYGPEFEYVKNVYCSLEKIKNEEMILFLQMHRQNSIKLLEHLNTNN